MTEENRISHEVNHSESGDRVINYGEGEDDGKTHCQYCEDVGPCSYCERGKDVQAQIIRNRRS